MRPTGRLHLGHYHGVLKNWIRLQAEYPCLFFVADWHALTTDYENPQSVKDNGWDMVVDWLAAEHRLPAIYDRSAFVEAGGLLSYGANLAELSRRAAEYVDQIFKGAKPEDLTLVQPTKFDLSINLKTAQQIGVTIPPNLLARADQIIK